jgi:hypothetical protein
MRHIASRSLLVGAYFGDFATGEALARIYVMGAEFWTTTAPEAPAPAI